MSKKKPTRIKSIAVVFASLAAALFFALGLLSFNPHWLIPWVQKKLQNDDINAKFSQVEAKWQGFNDYLITTKIAGNTQDNRVVVKNAQLDVHLKPLNFFVQKAFIQQLNITQLQLATTTALAEKLKGSSSKPIPAIFYPKHWMLACTTCSIRGNNPAFLREIKLSGKLSGQSNQAFHGQIDDADIGQLSVAYDGRKRLISAQSAKLDLDKLTGYPVQLAPFIAAINLSDFWKSQLSANIKQQQKTSDITLLGNDKNSLNLQIVVNEAGSPPLTQSLSLSADGQRHLYLHGRHIDLAFFNKIKSIFLPILKKQMTKQQLANLKSLQTRGNVQLEVALDYDNLAVKKAHLLLEDAGFQFNHHLLNHLSGQVDYDGKHLKYQLNLKDSQVKIPEVFSRDWAAVTGSLVGKWHMQTQQWQFEQIDFSSKDFKQLSAKGAIDLSSPARINLAGHITEFNLANLKNYLPNQLSKAANDWLSQAFLSGKNNQTQFVIQGNLEQFLDDKNFRLFFDIHLNDGVFSYLPKNPQIAIQKARLLINRKKLTVDIPNASLFTKVAGRVTQAPVIGSVEIEDLAKTLVKVKTKIKSKAVKQLLYLAKHSIARKVIHQVQKIARFNGQFDLGIDLWLDFPHEKYDFDISLDSDKASASLVEFPKLIIRNAKANALINEQGLQQLNIVGQLLGRKTTIDLSEINLKAGQKIESGYLLNIKAQAANPLLILPRLKLISLQQAALLQKEKIIRGSSNYQVKAKLYSNGKIAEIHLVSGLKNTAVNLFSLVNKTAQTTLPMRFDFSNIAKRGQLHLDKRLQADFGFNAAGNLTGLLLDNRKSGKNYQKGRINIFWHGKGFNAHQLNRLYRLFSAQKANPKRAQKKPRELKYDVDIDIKQLKVAKDKTINLNLLGKAGRWTINSPWAKGSLSYDKQLLTGHLTKLDISPFFKRHQSTNTQKSQKNKAVKIAPSKAQVKKRQLPALELVVDNLTYQGNTIGRAELQTTIDNTLYAIKQLLITGDNFYLHLAGREQRDDGKLNSQISVDMKAEKLKKVIALFKLNPFLDGKFFDASLNLSWQGSLSKFDLNKADGMAITKAQNIKLTHVSSGVGSLFGMMDIAGILKRISLDFKNLNSSKLSFDEISGYWRLSRAKLSTQNLHATGSIIAIKLAGAIDLQKQLFNHMDMIIIPKASNIFPVIGAAAGGVVGVAAGFVVQQAVGDLVNEAVGQPYVLSGSWQAPKIEFNAKKASVQGVKGTKK